MSTINIQIENIHCEQCELFLSTLLSEFFNLPLNSCEPSSSSNLQGSSLTLKPPSSSIVSKVQFNKIDAAQFRVSRDTGSCTIGFNQETNFTKLCQKIKEVLEDAGFLILDIYALKDLENLRTPAVDKPSHQSIRSWWRKLLPFGTSDSPSNKEEIHRQHCEYCRSHGDKQRSQIENSNSEVVTYETTLAIEGMSCASCSNRIEQVVGEQLRKDESIGVDLMTGMAKLFTRGQRPLEPILESIRDSGYDVEIIKIININEASKFKMVAAIDGITCAACASTINHSIQDLPFVEEVAINVISKTGTFILNSQDKNQLDQLKETIEDTGYDIEPIGKLEPVNYIPPKSVRRSIMLRIDGIYCIYCPQRIYDALNQFEKANIVVDKPISLKEPILKFTYTPNVTEGITVRSIIDTIIKQVSVNSDNNFKISIIEELTLEEHLKRMAKKTTRQILIKLAVTTIVTIPTFIFGVVGMSLLKESNGFRRWLEEPLWSGNVSKIVWILFILSTPIYFFIDDIFHRKAIKEVRALWVQKNNWKRRIFKFGSMNLLMSLGTSVAYFASIILLSLSASKRSQVGKMPDTTTYFDSVVFLSFFLLIGRLLEGFSKSKSAAAITNLSSMKQHSAKLVENYGSEMNTEKTVDVKYLEVDDYIKISSGESPPADCIIIQGETQFDESALTGESIPVTHYPGEQIFTGTVNIGRHTIIAKLIASEGDSLLDKIVSSVRDGQLKRAPMEKLADALTGYFVPIITFLAVTTWVIWLSLGYSHKLPPSYLDKNVGGWAVWSLEFAISVFVVACPCGLGLAAPTALFVGSGLAAKYGILVKGGGASFQEGSQISVICFDKTGTLTKGGAPKITDHAIINNPKIRTITAHLIRDLEISSKHPLALGITDFIAESFTLESKTRVTDTEEIAGQGMRGRVSLAAESSDVWNEVNPRGIILGNERFMSSNGVSLTSHHLQLLHNWKVESKSVVIAAIESPDFFQKPGYFPVMLLAARDEIRPESSSVIKGLQSMGIECWMISGDNELTARSIARDIGIDQVVAEVLPQEKADKVKWIQQTYRQKNGKPAVVAMVGDGINDAPAMAMADVGVALASGSDLAMISCDFVLLSSTYTLRSLLFLFQLSKIVLRRVHFNFAWAICYNIITIPIAAGVIYPHKHARLSPVWASAAMAFSSVSVLLSSLTLRFYKPKKVSLADDAPLPSVSQEYRFN
ncbi:hypothetical protein ZYGM_000878 [Zygosaccharomyces mellis]|uniref:HMA domain-containing protein n=1 Tax=Zygosaccharomyces mellis TaxID=42258 RepID=A0A4C2EC20_9SACH|nr:hypothetical protein ZYGM_000878 [Zygosaccharomyces mellis]